MTLFGATCFSGIGAPELAGPQFSWRWSAEFDKGPARILAARYPDVPNLSDVTAPDFIERAKALGPLDLLVGGPPCQAFSFAGLRQSLGDARGNLSLRFVEIAHAIRPRNLLVENVPGWLSTDDNAFGCFLGAIVGGDAPLLPCESAATGPRAQYWRKLDDGRLAPKWPSAGMVAGPLGRAAWRVFDAQHFGLAQRRSRVFVVVDFGNGADPARVLFERRGLRGNNPPSRETGEGIAGTLSARSQGGGGLGTDLELDGGLIAKALLASTGQRLDPETENLLPVTVGALTEVGGNARPGESLQSIGQGYIIPELAHTLRGEGPHDTANLRAASGGSSRSYVATRYAVRRLTPVECERLQGFLDGFTLVEGKSWRKISPEMALYLMNQGAEVVGDEGFQLRTRAIADGPRYKALGNSWAVACGRWIIGRLAEGLES